MRITTILAFVTGYAVAHYGLFAGQWASLSPEQQLFVGSLGAGLVVAIFIDKLYVTPRVSPHE